MWSVDREIRPNIAERVRAVPKLVRRRIDPQLASLDALVLVVARGQVGNVMSQFDPGRVLVLGDM